jgi:peptidase E
MQVRSRVMGSTKGVIALMGSGELTASMVEVHKGLISSLSVPVRAVFLDTPAGFQLNVDQLSKKACEYFKAHIQQTMETASFKSLQLTKPYETEKAFQTLRQANYILIGPGSPTYAVRQWRQTPVPDILAKRIEAGGCLVAASAAALTVGSFTLPVYEIYKVGGDLHWVEGINILSHFGLNLVVIPHWNNAEGGTHDTRFCYMGESRFGELEALLPEEVSVLGLDEHTACLMDLEEDEAVVKGIGRVTIRSSGKEMFFERGERFSLDLLREGRAVRVWEDRAPEQTDLISPSTTAKHSFWERVHAIDKAFQASLEKDESKQATNALLELDEALWRAQEDLENEEFISQAREILREMIVLLGLKLESRSDRDSRDLLKSLVETLVEAREECRRSKRWKEADEIREKLHQGGIVVQDTPSGPRWKPPY